MMNLSLDKVCMLGSAPQSLRTERSILSGAPQCAVEGRGAAISQRPHPSTAPVILPTGSAQDAYQSVEQTVQLGKTGVRVPPLGAGTWQWGDSMFWGYGKGYAEEQVRAAFEASLAAGVDFFDTAEIYGQGRSERFLGRFINSDDRGGAATAGEGAALTGDGRGPIVATKFMPLPWRLGKGALLSALRGSLARLGLAQVDLYQIHWPTPPVSIEAWAEALADAVAAGLTRAVGVSNYNADQMRRAHAVLARRGVPLASNQVEYSLLHREPERNGLLQACQELDVTLIAYSPLAKGVLTGKYTPENPPPGFRSRRYRGDLLAGVRPLIGLLQEIGRAHGGKTPGQVALNWVICKGALPIPGAKNAQQAQGNAGALGWRLTEAEVAALDRASAGLLTPPAPLS